MTLVVPIGRWDRQIRGRMLRRSCGRLAVQGWVSFVRWTQHSLVVAELATTPSWADFGPPFFDGVPWPCQPDHLSARSTLGKAESLRIAPFVRGFG